MIRSCACGQMMRLELRTVMYTHRVQIMHVPVLACNDCNSYDLLGPIKSEIISYMKQLGVHPESMTVSFTTISELSELIYSVFAQVSDHLENVEEKVEEALHERINMLLDLYTYASRVKDNVWMEKITSRLAPLSAVMREESRIHVNFHEK